MLKDCFKLRKKLQISKNTNLLEALMIFQMCRTTIAMIVDDDKLPDTQKPIPYDDLKRKYNKMILEKQKSEMHNEKE